MTSAQESEKLSKSNEVDEFDEYLKNQCMKTTFNGIEIETFKWYTKMLGMK